MMPQATCARGVREVWLKQKDTKMNEILGIDPGQKGALVLLGVAGQLKGFWPMPVTPEKDIDFIKLSEILADDIGSNTLVFLERAVPFAQGMKQAFSYGRGFAAVEIALKLAELSVTYVEPSKWTKYIHQGVDQDLKPKVKSVIAFGRLYPKLISKIPHTINRKGEKKFDEGIVDALLIATYGYRFLAREHLTLGF